MVVGMAFAAMPIVGCGTVNNLTRPNQLSQEYAPTEPVRQVYGGVRAEWSELNRWGYEPEAVPFALIFKAATCIDLPFTVIGDTLTLPFTIAADVQRGISEYYFPSEATDEKARP